VPHALRIPQSEIARRARSDAAVKANRIASLGEESQEGEVESVKGTEFRGENRSNFMPLSLLNFNSHRVRLFFSEIADHRQLVHLALIRLDKEHDPDHENPNPHGHPEKEHHQVSEERDEC